MFDKFSFNKNNKRDLRDSGTLKIPKHVAIIMDGNGRWAQRRGLPRIAGHREALKTIKRVTYEAQHLGVKFLTLYAFSTENWKRPKSEVDFLMKIPEQFLNSYLVELIEHNVQVKIMGDMKQIPDHTMRAVTQAVRQTERNTGLVLTFAFNYGGHAELVHAVRSIVDEVLKGKRSAATIDESLVASHMLNPNLPDPDLLIRTGGELRISNFMLWQIAYTELYFTDIFWPDFSEKDLRDAVREFSRRQRRFGGIIEKGGENQ
ncbi:MAG: isoprenyl transferase [Sporolactobacillus sp.]|jgi:undecaprenyl diphosphate synthase|nr:isoprenyl transferase [Sporolactobacillus sp.]MCI1882994.1 isoprenyl transferase [Sporolactobacillus sp.]